MRLRRQCIESFLCKKVRKLWIFEGLFFTLMANPYLEWCVIVLHYYLPVNNYVIHLFFDFHGVYNISHTLYLKFEHSCFSAFGTQNVVFTPDTNAILRYVSASTMCINTVYILYTIRPITIKC